MIDSKKRADTENENSLLTLAESERKSIEQALIKCKGVIGGEKGAARLLGVARSTLQYRMKKHGIKPKKIVLLEN
jgi:formate hydrogenlyase transcriptional activator